MTRIGEFITGVAVIAFMIALCTIESLSLFSIITMIVSGSWIVGYGFVMEEVKGER